MYIVIAAADVVRFVYYLIFYISSHIYIYIHIIFSTQVSFQFGRDTILSRTRTRPSCDVVDDHRVNGVGKSRGRDKKRVFITSHPTGKYNNNNIIIVARARLYVFMCVCVWLDDVSTASGTYIRTIEYRYILVAGQYIIFLVDAHVGGRRQQRGKKRLNYVNESCEPHVKRRRYIRTPRYIF